MIHEIKNRYSGDIMAYGEADSFRALVMQTVKVRMNLIGADLSKADLSDADLSGADLSRAKLNGADLSDADLSGSNLNAADLIGADLIGANLRGADLRAADFSRADLTGTDLGKADLRGSELCGAILACAYLRGSNLNWDSHNLLSELIRREAGDDLEKRKFSGLVAISRDWGWLEFLAVNTPELGWALEVLAPYVQADDNAPLAVRAVAERLAKERTDR